MNLFVIKELACNLALSSYSVIQESGGQESEINLLEIFLRWRKRMGLIDINIKNVRDFLLRKEKVERINRQKEKAQIVLKLKELNAIFERYEVERVYLYGAFANMTFHRYSDIDIAIEPNIPYKHLLEMYSQIDKHFKREVDLRLLSELPFSVKVKKKGVIVYERKNSHTKK